MFSFFKRKKHEQPQEPTPEELEQMAVGDNILAKMEPFDYLTNVSALITNHANEMPLFHIYGHIHTCIKLGAPAIVSTLAQLAAYRLREYDDDPDIKRHIKEFEQLAMQSAIDALNYMAANGKQLVYC